MSWSLRRRPDGTHANALAFPDGIGDQDRPLPTGRLEAFSDGVFAIAITLLVLELHAPGRGEVLVRSLEHEWPRYLAYVVSFAFIGGVWIAHSNMTRFIKAADPALMRLNLSLLLFVSLLPFTTAIAATHLFATFLSFDDHGSGPGLGEGVAAVVFGLNLTLAALMVYRVMRHAARTPGLAADDLAEEQLQAFSRERRAAAQLQPAPPPWASSSPVIATVFYLAVSVLFIVEPLRHLNLRGRRAAQSGPQG